MSQRKAKTEERTGQLVLLDQQLALSAYLQALLNPVETPVEVLTEAPPATSTEIPVQAPVVSTLVKTPAVATEVEATPVPAPVIEPVTEQVAAPVATSPYPDWAGADFQCLLFRVGGLTLALPLAKLNGVLPWDAERVTPLPGHKPWFLGLREYQGQQVRLIEVAKVIELRDEQADAAQHGKVILIGDGRWGLACDEIAEVVTLAPAAVKWRGRTGSRPWLAGTVIERMCALLDADALAAMLASDGPRG